MRPYLFVILLLLGNLLAAIAPVQSSSLVDVPFAHDASGWDRSALPAEELATLEPWTGSISETDPSRQWKFHPAPPALAPRHDSASPARVAAPASGAGIGRPSAPSRPDAPRAPPSCSLL